MNETDVQDAIVEIFGLSISERAARLIFLVAVIIIAFIVSKLLTRTMKRLFTRSKVPSASIFINIVRGLVWSFALLSVLDPVFGIDPAGFITALGITSVALSLGLQDTVSNLFGGLSLMTSKVIEPGDVITVSGITGEVTDITWRSTMVRQRSGDVEVIPNSVLSKTALTKLAPFQANEAQLPVTIAPDADLAQVRKDIDDAARRALGAHYDEAFGALLFLKETNFTGVLATVSIHVKPGMSFGVARTAVAERLVDKPWLIGPPGQEQDRGQDQGQVRGQELGMAVTLATSEGDEA